MRGGRWAAVADAHLVVGGAGGGPAFLEHPRELRGCQLVLPLLDRERLLQRGQLGVAPLEEEAQIVDVIVPRRRGGRRRRRGGGGGGLAGGLLHHRRAGLADHGCGAGSWQERGRGWEAVRKALDKRIRCSRISKPRAWTAPPSPPPPPPPPPRFVWWVCRRRRRRSRCRAWRSAGRLRPPAPMVQWADEKRPARRRARRRGDRGFRILHELYLVRCSLP